MKTEWLIDNVTAVGPPTGVESAVFWDIVDVCCPNWATFVAGESLYDLEIPS